MTSKGRDGILSTLDTVIRTLNLAKDASGIPPAQTAFGSASTLLAMIKVYSFALCDNELPVQIHSGLHGQQTRLCQSGTILR